MRQALLLLVLLVNGSGSTAQDLLQQRHTLIDSLYRSERHAELIRTVDAQLAAAAGTAWADSLHRYLYAYGRAHWKLHGPDRAMAAAERVWALVDRLDADPNHRLDALGDLSWLYYEVGRSPDCLRVDSLALALAVSSPNVPALRKGKAHQYLGFDHSMLGDHARALEHFLAAKRIYDADGAIPVMYQAETCNGIGASFWHLGRTRDAEAFYRNALDLLGDAGELELLSRKASTVGNLAILWEDAGDLTRSKRWYEENLRINDRVIADTDDPFQRDEMILNRARTYANLAALYFSTGDHATAARYLDLSEQGREQVLEPGDPQLLAIQERRADLALAAGRPLEAQRLLRRYMEVCEIYYGARSELLARALSKQAEVAAALDQREEAETLFARCIAMHRALSDAPTDPVLALTLQRRAAFFQKLERMDAAIADLEEARAILERVHGARNERVAAVDLALVEAAVRSGQWALARQALDRAMRVLQDRFRELQGPPVPQAYALPHLVPDAVYWQVVLERSKEGRTVAPEKLLTLLEPGMRALSRNKAALLDEGSRLLLVGTQERLFHLALDIAAEAAVKNPYAWVERFFQLAETDRTVLLKSRLNTFSSLRYTGVPDTLLQQEAALLKALGEREDAATYRDRQRDEEQLEHLLTVLERDHPDYFTLRYGERPVTLAAAREALLTKERVLLHYSFTDTGLFALVVRSDTAVLMRLPAHGVADAIDRLDQAVGTRHTASYLDTAHDLYRTLVAPLSALLGQRELLVVPDGPLHRLNFEVLLDAPVTAGDFREHLLLRRHAIAYLLSATTAIQFRGLKREQGGGALVLAPGFGSELKEQYRRAQADSTRWDRGFLSLVRQPFMQRTARHVGELFPARLLMEAEATESRFRSEAGRHGILHLGTHAEMNSSDPLYSRLVLSKDGASLEPDADGYLHAYEIYELQLRAELAVLSACETGAGDLTAGEGVRSLAHSFAYAGCPSLVMALWQVDEKSTAEIVDRFYVGLAEGLPKHEALRRAKLHFLDHAQGELVLPYYWAGLVLVGDVDVLGQGSRGLPWWIWAAIALLLAALVRRWWLQRGRST